MPTAQTAPATDARVLGVLQALADEKRLRILDALRGGERCVCELQADLEMGQSLLSHHLRALREAGLVRDRRDGRWVHYSLLPEALTELEGYLGAVRSDVAAAATRAGFRACGP